MFKNKATRTRLALAFAAMLPLAAHAEGFDASTAISGLSTQLETYGAAGLVLLGIVLAITIGIKFAKRIANKST